MLSLTRPSVVSLRSPPLCSRAQTRHATLIRRPKRPYTFTQLITLSDGSTFLHRTTSPQPVYRSVKDTKNSVLWNPSSQKLLNVEEDEAGRLKRFRKRFGRGFDAEAVDQDQEGGDGEDGQEVDHRDESLLDLIAGYAQHTEQKSEAVGVREPATKSEKGKGGQK